MLGDRLATSLGPVGVANLRYGWPRHCRANAAQVPIRQGRFVIVSDRLIDRCHQLGEQVHGWTIDDPAEMHRLLDLGSDGIMTDRPAVLRQVFEERGVWR